MKVNSLVQYVSGQDAAGQRLSPLSTSDIYTVSCICNGKFSDGWKPAIYLVEKGNVYAFRKSMFKEVQPPMNINVNEICNNEEAEITREVEAMG